MAASDWLISELISGLKRRGNIPTSSESWTEADFRALADDEMRSYVVPLLRRLNEEYFVHSADTAVVAGTAGYRLPARASGESVHDVLLGTVAAGFTPLDRLEAHGTAGSAASAAPAGYYLEDDKVVLFPSPAAAGDTLRIRYLIRPNKLVDESGCYKVASIATNTLNVTPLDSSVVTDAATLLGATATLDVIRAKPGFRHVVIGASVTITVNAVTITDSIAGVEVGDYVCTSEESPVPQVPAELHPLLAQAVACAWLRASSSPGLDTAEAKLTRMEADAINLFSPRTENQARYVVNHEGPGWAGPRLRRRIP